MAGIGSALVAGLVIIAVAIFGWAGIARANTPAWAAEPAFAFEAALADTLPPSDSADIQPRHCARLRPGQLRCRFRVRTDGGPWCRQYAVLRRRGWRPGVRGNTCAPALRRGWRRVDGVYLDG